MTTSSPPPVRPLPGSRQGSRPAPRRRRVRLLPLLLAAWVVLEIWVLTVVAEATSGLVVLLCVAAGFVLGAAAVKRAGRSAWRNLTTSLQAQQAGPGARSGAAAPPAGGGRTGLHMLGGLLLMIPGFVSDAAALVLLFPPTRKAVGAVAERTAERHLRRHPASAPEPGSLGDLFQQARDVEEQSRIHRPDGKVIRGEVIDRD